MEILSFLVLPFIASLILTGIHAYLGVHVVERGVIFVDLALAQIAALGATMAILLGMDPHGNGAGPAIDVAPPRRAEEDAGRDRAESICRTNVPVPFSFSTLRWDQVKMPRLFAEKNAGRRI